METLLRKFVGLILTSLARTAKTLERVVEHAFKEEIEKVRDLFLCLFRVGLIFTFHVGEFYYKGAYYFNDGLPHWIRLFDRVNDAQIRR